MVLTRPDDSRFDSFRSPSIQTLRMGFGDGGKVTAMEHHASAGWPTLIMAEGFMSKGLHQKLCDPFAISGAERSTSPGSPNSFFGSGRVPLCRSAVGHRAHGP